MPNLDRIHSQVGRYYSDKLAEHGETHRGVDWSSRESQFVRFDQLLSLHRGGSEPFSILDYGCGYGALVEYLEQREFRYEYTGFDISTEMIRAASERFGANATVSFASEHERLATADYVVASGIFNVRLETPKLEWSGYILETLGRMWAASKKGMAFNSLTSYSDEPLMKDYLSYADPCELFDHCKRNFSKQVALLHDYGLYEFTILVRRE